MSKICTACWLVNASVIYEMVIYRLWICSTGWKEGFWFNCCGAKYMTRPRNWKEARSLHCWALITHHGDRDAPPLYLAVSISYLAVNSPVKHQLLALACVQAHLTMNPPSTCLLKFLRGGKTDSHGLNSWCRWKAFNHLQDMFTFVNVFEATTTKKYHASIHLSQLHFTSCAY